MRYMVNLVHVAEHETTELIPVGRRGAHDSFATLSSCPNHVKKVLPRNNDHQGIKMLLPLSLGNQVGKRGWRNTRE